MRFVDVDSPGMNPDCAVFNLLPSLISSLRWCRMVLSTTLETSDKIDMVLISPTFGYWWPVLDRATSLALLR